DRAATILARDGRISPFYTSGHWGEGRRVRGILGLSPELQRQENLTNYCAVLDEEAPPSVFRLRRSLLGALLRRQVPTETLVHVRARLEIIRTAVAAHRGIAGHAPLSRVYLVKNVMEQTPNPESRIMLGRDRDQLGCPRVVL